MNISVIYGVLKAIANLSVETESQTNKRFATIETNCNN